MRDDKSQRDTYRELRIEDAETSSFLTPTRARGRRRPLTSNVTVKLTILAWISSFLFLTTALYWRIYPSSAHEPTDLECTRKLHADSPLFEAIEYEDVQFDNGFWDANPYKGKPDPELEARWLALWDFGTFDVPRNRLPLLNKSDDEPWVVSEKGGLMAGLEVFHTLHCLDMIRQHTYRDVYDYSDNLSFQDSPEFVRIVTDKTPLGITPDFDTQHRCPNFGKIQKWAEAHEAGPAPGQLKDVGDMKHSHGGH
ncbi:hypothetical protein F4778DRAFT_794563 [Xylariomycetidae sp. FL2044]|nr:hypothetical protein F4778DRAFT_794563 [Xylariomycetidae sp. FL2044]